MTVPKSHGQHRANVCAICYDENGKRVARPVCPAEEEIIQKFISRDFSSPSKRKSLPLDFAFLAGLTFGN